MHDEQEVIYWHDAFYEALQLEFHQYQQFLDFEKEHQLSKEALKIDVLVIKKRPGIQINKNIGRIFKTHNVFEYKSETDSLIGRDYNKVVAYALLYSSFIPVAVSEITISFSITVHPRELLKYLRDERGFKIVKTENGIYYVEGDTFPVQIIENKLLPKRENLFLRNLRSSLTTEDVTKTAVAYKKLKPFEKKNVYLDRIIQANPTAFEEAISVSEAVKELFFKVAEKDGWLEQERLEYAKVIAKRMLLYGRPVEEVVEVTQLPYEIVMSLMEHDVMNI